MKPPLAHLAPAQSQRGTLAGIRVLDLSRLVAGNMLSLQLADFGADVIKIEALEGDTLRHWRETLDDGGSLDAWWRVYGRNKRSVALDLRDPEAMAVLRSLIASAQVLVESFRPGTLEAMGLAPQALHAANPRLVIVRVSGWGQTGPYRDLPGFGSLIEGISGFAHKHSTAEGEPRLPNMALADMVAGLNGAFATMVALREVEVNGGQGQVVDLSLLEPMLAVMGPDAAICAATGKVPAANVKIASPRGVYRCRDGRWVAMSGSTDVMARRVLDAIGQGPLAQDPRFATNAARIANDEELDGMIAAAIGGMSQPECLALFRGKGVTVGPIYDAQQLQEDEHVVLRESYVRFGAGAGTVMHNVTPRLSGTPGSIRSEAPAIGQDTAQVLREAGVGEEKLQSMAQRGAVRCI